MSYMRSLFCCGCMRLLAGSRNDGEISKSFQTNEFRDEELDGSFHRVPITESQRVESPCDSATEIRTEMTAVNNQVFSDNSGTLVVKKDSLHIRSTSTMLDMQSSRGDILAVLRDEQISPLIFQLEMETEPTTSNNVLSDGTEFVGRAELTLKNSKRDANRRVHFASREIFIYEGSSTTSLDCIFMLTPFI